MSQSNQQLLDLSKQRPVSVSDAITVTGKSEYLARLTIGRLVAKGLLKPTASGYVYGGSLWRAA